MDIKFFSDIIDAIEKATKSIKAIADLPKQTREELYQTLNDTFKLLDSTLLIVIARLNNILMNQDDDAFKKEVEQLYVDDSWAKVEREFRLCGGLKRALIETNSLGHKILNTVSFHDWNDMKSHLQQIFRGEDDMGDFISRNFQSISDQVYDKTTQQTRSDLKQFLVALIEERKRLIKMESELMDSQSDSSLQIR